MGLHRCSLIGQACGPPRGPTLSLYNAAISWVRATHGLSVAAGERLCLRVLCVLLSITSAKGQEAAVVELTLLPTASALVISPVAQFVFPNTAAEDQRVAGAWLGSREKMNGGMEEDGEKRGWERRFLCETQFMHFSAIINSQRAKFFQTGADRTFVRSCSVLW